MSSPLLASVPGACRLPIFVSEVLHKDARTNGGNHEDSAIVRFHEDLLTENKILEAARYGIISCLVDYPLHHTALHDGSYVAVVGGNNQVVRRKGNMNQPHIHAISVWNPEVFTMDQNGQLVRTTFKIIFAFYYNFELNLILLNISFIFFFFFSCSCYIVTI